MLQLFVPIHSKDFPDLTEFHGNQGLKSTTSFPSKTE